jgi:hypothetical protein
MAEFFGSRIFEFLVLPLMAAALGVFVKMVSRNDTHASFAKEDVAVGLDLALTAMVTLLIYSIKLARMVVDAPKDPAVSADLQRRMIEYPWLVAALVFGLWGVSTVVRKLGWEERDKLRWGAGIIFPLLYGFVSLVAVVSWIGG